MKHNKTFAAFILFLGAALLMPVEAWSFTIMTDLMTYQGRLRENSVPVDGNRDVQISICDVFASGSGTCYSTGVQTVTAFKGLFRTTFTVPATVDFGLTTAWFLEVAVGPEGGGLSTLQPREMFTKVPYAIFAGTVAAAGIKPGTIVPGVHFSSHVGIGTANPIRELEVIGTITADRYEIAGSTVIAVLPGTGSLGVGVGAGRISAGDNNSFLGYQAGYNNITSNGSVFLGWQAGYNETAANKLYISNSNTATPLIWGDFSTGDVVINGTLAQTSVTSCDLQADGSGILTCVSDERLKDILGPFTRGVEDLKGIAPVTFRFKEDSGFTGTFTGFTAQNVAEHIPEAVTEQPSGMLGLSDRPILATMLNAILEQQKRIDEQQKRIEDLEAKLEQR